MLKNKMKKLICGITMCITVCSQMIFPQTAFAATKAAVEKAGEAFVAGMTETAEAEEVLSEEELRQQIVDFALQFEGNPFYGSGISHVALYIGNGQIIHASTSASGIKISNYDYEAPVGVGTYIEADGFFSE